MPRYNALLSELAETVKEGDRLLVLLKESDVTFEGIIDSGTDWRALPYSYTTMVRCLIEHEEKARAMRDKIKEATKMSHPTVKRYAALKDEEFKQQQEDLENLQNLKAALARDRATIALDSALIEKLNTKILNLQDDIKRQDANYDRMNLKNYELFDEADDELNVLKKALEILSKDDFYYIPKRIYKGVQEYDTKTVNQIQKVALDALKTVKAMENDED